MVETYRFSLGDEIISVPSTVTYDELITELGEETIVLILLIGSSSSWEELIEKSKNTRNRSGNQSQQECIAQAIIGACKQLSVSQGRFSINKTE